MEKEAEKMKDEDQKLKEVIDWKNKSDNLIFSTEKHLE
jgi:molecular chaperone DnaK (HSP70)